jgi:hypothetical protein
MECPLQRLADAVDQGNWRLTGFRPDLKQNTDMPDQVHSFSLSLGYLPENRQAVFLMTKPILLLVLSLGAAAPAAAQFTYPETRKTETIDTYFGTIVSDPYRWLEDDYAEETKAWVRAQNEVTFGYLNQIPFRKQWLERLEKTNNYPKYGSPFRNNGYYYFYKNDGLQNQSVLYRQKGLKGKPEIVIDPNTLSEKRNHLDGHFLAIEKREVRSDRNIRRRLRLADDVRAGYDHWQKPRRHHPLGQSNGRKLAGQRILLQPLSETGARQGIVHQKREPPGFLPHGWNIAIGRCAGV